MTDKIIDTLKGSAYYWNDTLFDVSDVVYEPDAMWPTGYLKPRYDANKRIIPGHEFRSFATSRLYVVKEIASFEWSALDLLGPSSASQVLTAPLRAAAIEFGRSVTLRDVGDQRALFAVRNGAKAHVTIDLYLELESIPAKIQGPGDECNTDGR